MFLLRPGLRPYWDVSILVHADFEVTVRRAADRDLELFGSEEAVRLRYERRYVPGQERYLSEVQPERWASIVIDNNDPDKPSIVRGWMADHTEGSS